MTTWIQDIHKFHSTFPDIKYTYSRVDSASSSGQGGAGVEYERLIELIGQEEGTFIPVRGYQKVDRFPYWLVNVATLRKQENAK